MPPLNQQRALERGQHVLLDFGCGGGILAEEFARAGSAVTGIDPAPESVATARAHAAATRLAIDYRVGTGEQLPWAHPRHRVERLTATGTRYPSRVARLRLPFAHR